MAILLYLYTSKNVPEINYWYIKKVFAIDPKNYSDYIIIIFLIRILMSFRSYLNYILKRVKMNGLSKILDQAKLGNLIYKISNWYTK